MILVDNIQVLDSMIADLIKPGNILALDIETTALEPRHGKIRLIQLKAPEGDVYIVDVFKFDSIEQLRKLAVALADPSVKKIIQNYKFEYKWFLYHFGVHLTSVFDTYLASILVSFSGNHDLASIANIYIGVDISKVEQKSDWSANVLSKEQYEYAAIDVLHLHRLREVLLQQLRETSQLEAAKLEFGVVPAVGSMELNGMPISETSYRSLVDTNKTIRDEKGIKLLQFLQTRGGSRPLPKDEYQYDIFGNAVKVGSSTDINIDSWQQVLPIFQEMGYPISSTSEKFIAPYQKEYEGIGILLDYRGYQKLCTTYGDVFLDAIEGDTLYTGYNQFGTITARFSGQKPNVLTIPREQRFRECFAVREGEVMCICDYSQMELRILAAYSKDPVMLDAYKTGKDLHTLTASGVYGIPYDQIRPTHEEKRTLSKITNFSVVYGISPSALMLRLQGQGLHATEESAKELIDGFYSTYSMAGKWLFERERQIMRDNHLRSIGGHLIKVIFDKNDSGSVSSAKRNARNYLIQAGNSCATKLAMTNLYNDIIKNNRSFKIRNVVHDELVVTSKAEDSEELKLLVGKYMQEAGAFYFPNVPIEADAKIGKTWGCKQ